jgi:hypothetical protein
MPSGEVRSGQVPLRPIRPGRWGAPQQQQQQIFGGTVWWPSTYQLHGTWVIAAACRYTDDISRDRSTSSDHSPSRAGFRVRERLRPPRGAVRVRAGRTLCRSRLSHHTANAPCGPSIPRLACGPCSSISSASACSSVAPFPRRSRRAFVHDVLDTACCWARVAAIVPRRGARPMVAGSSPAPAALPSAASSWRRCSSACSD